MKYAANTTHDLTNLTDREMSVIQAALASVITGGNWRYPEYKDEALKMLTTLNPDMAMNASAGR